MVPAQALISGPSARRDERSDLRIVGVEVTRLNCSGGRKDQSLLELGIELRVVPLPTGEIGGQRELEIYVSLSVY